MITYQVIILFIIGVAWVGGGNYILYRSFKRRNMSIWNLFNPSAVLKLEGGDYLKIFVSAVLVLVFGAIALSLGP